MGGDNHHTVVAGSNTVAAGQLSAYARACGQFQKFSFRSISVFIFHYHHLEKCSLLNFLAIWASSTTLSSLSSNVQILTYPKDVCCL